MVEKIFATIGVLSSAVMSGWILFKVIDKFVFDDDLDGITLLGVVAGLWFLFLFGMAIYSAW